ncbi:GNAT family N-acetyltransferase [Vibrio mimicus]
MIVELNNRDVDVANKILNVSLNAYRVEAKLLGLVSFPPMNEKAESIVSSQSRFLGFMSEGVLFGVIEVEVIGSGRLHINRLVVDPSMFRKGIASKLIDAVLAQGQVLSVTTAASNSPAMSLYQSHGFTLVNIEVVGNRLELGTLKKQT